MATNSKARHKFTHSWRANLKEAEGKFCGRWFLWMMPSLLLWRMLRQDTFSKRPHKVRWGLGGWEPRTLASRLKSRSPNRKKFPYIAARWSENSRRLWLFLGSWREFCRKVPGKFRENRWKIGPESRNAINSRISGTRERQTCLKHWVHTSESVKCRFSKCRFSVLNLKFDFISDGGCTREKQIQKALGSLPPCRNRCRFSESAICSSRVHPPSEIKSNFKFKTLRWRPLRWRLTLSEHWPGPGAGLPCGMFFEINSYSLLEFFWDVVQILDIFETPVTVTPQQEISKTLNSSKIP